MARKNAVTAHSRTETRRERGRTEVLVEGFAGEALVVYSGNPEQARKFRRRFDRVLQSILDEAAKVVVPAIIAQTFEAIAAAAGEAADRVPCAKPAYLDGLQTIIDDMESRQSACRDELERGERMAESIDATRTAEAIDDMRRAKAR